MLRIAIRAVGIREEKRVLRVELFLKKLATIRIHTLAIAFGDMD